MIIPFQSYQSLVILTQHKNGNAQAPDLVGRASFALEPIVEFVLDSIGARLPESLDSAWPLGQCDQHGASTETADVLRPR
jgi:hypothetical protein